MQNIGLTEILIVAFLLIMFFGASRLPVFGKGLGQAKTEFKKGLKDTDENSSVNKKK